MNMSMDMSMDMDMNMEVNIVMATTRAMVSESSKQEQWREARS